jgi:hypothetical protein
MRSLVTSTFALALALAPAAAFAQTSTAQQPPAGQPPAGQPPAAAQPAASTAPKVAFTAPAGLLLVQVKADQTAVFEEMMGKIKSGVANSADPAVKAQAGSWHYYKATEPAGSNVMYVVVIEPAKPDTEYQFLEVLNKTLTDEQKRDPATQDMYKKYAGAIATMNKLNITPGGGL